MFYDEPENIRLKVRKDRYTVLFMYNIHYK